MCTDLEPICSYLVQILERKAACQLDPDELDEASVATGELSEADSSVIACAADLVGSLATALSADFSTAFGQFLPHLVKYTDPKFSPSDRANTVGAIAEIINGIGGAVTPYTEQLLPVSMAVLADADPEVRSNAAFMTGSLVFWSDADLSAQYLPVLGRLQPFFGSTEGASNQDKLDLARDNAAGALARLILKNKAALPQDQVCTPATALSSSAETRSQVLPVFFAALPLRRDFAEYPKCLDAIYNLFQEQNPAIQAHFEHLLDVFAHVLAPTANPDEAPLNDETRAQLLAFLRVRFATHHRCGELMSLPQSLNARAPDQLASKGLNRYL